MSESKTGARHGLSNGDTEGRADTPFPQEAFPGLEGNGSGRRLQQCEASGAELSPWHKMGKERPVEGQGGTELPRVTGREILCSQAN